MKRNGIFAALSVCLFLCVGCAGTSEAFKRSIARPVADAADDLSAYATKTQDTGNQQLAANLRASVADTGKITVEDVRQAWEPAKPVLSDYISNDPALDLKSINIRMKTLNDIDDTISAEESRKKSFWENAIPSQR